MPPSMHTQCDWATLTKLRNFQAREREREKDSEDRPAAEEETTTLPQAIAWVCGGAKHRQIERRNDLTGRQTTTIWFYNSRQAHTEHTHTHTHIQTERDTLVIAATNSCTSKVNIDFVAAAAIAAFRRLFSLDVREHGHVCSTLWRHKQLANLSLYLCVCVSLSCATNQALHDFESKYPNWNVKEHSWRTATDGCWIMTFNINDFYRFIDILRYYYCY